MKFTGLYNSNADFQASVTAGLLYFDNDERIPRHARRSVRGLSGYIHTYGKAHVQSRECGLQLLDAGRVVDIHEPLDLLLMDTHPARQFGFAHARLPHRHVEFRFGRAMTLGRPTRIGCFPRGLLGMGISRFFSMSAEIPSWSASGAWRSASSRLLPLVWVNGRSGNKTTNVSPSGWMVAG